MERGINGGDYIVYAIIVLAFSELRTFEPLFGMGIRNAPMLKGESGVCWMHEVLPGVSRSLAASSLFVT